MDPTEKIEVDLHLYIHDVEEDVLTRLKRIERLLIQEREQITMMDKTLAAQLDAATSSAADNFKKVQDALTAAGTSDGLTPAEASALSASLTSNIAVLNAMGKDPANPIPPVPPIVIPPTL